MNRPAPNREQAPSVQKLRLRFAKRGRLRFTSHRDFQRAFERALRRAGVPVAFSHGFTPHPKVAYAGAAPTGTSSEAEYLEFSTTRECDPEQVRTDLDAALPAGLEVVEVVVAGSGALADRLQASSWKIDFPQAEFADVDAAVEAFLAVSNLEVERSTKKGIRKLDARAAVVQASVDYDDPVTIRMIMRHESPTVRPEEILTALRMVTGFQPPASPMVTRLAQGVWDEHEGRLDDPLAAEKQSDHADGP